MLVSVGSNKLSHTTSAVFSGKSVTETLADFRLTHLHEEDAGAGRGVVIHVDVCKDGCCQQDHHYEDSHQQTHRRSLVGVGVRLLSCCTERMVRFSS